MDEFCGDPKFVITPRSCRLPEELLMASMSQRNFPNPAELQWSQRSAKAPLEPRELNNSLSRSSPRERRVLLQLASPQSPNGPVQDESNAITRTFPKQWGSPPSKLSPVKTRLPEGYGVGSATLRSWMIHRLHGAPAAHLAAGIDDASSDGTAMVTQQDDAAAAGISAWRRSALRHPDVPWAPDGGSWSDFKVKTELDSQRRRLQRETHVKSASCSALSGPLVPPVVPPLLLEPLRELVDARHERNGRAATPHSTRLLLHQLHMRTSAPIDQEPHGERASGADDVDGASADEGLRCSVDAQRPTLAVLAPETHAAALTQRLMRLSSLRKRFQELCAMNACEKEKAAAIIKQRAKVVRELRRQNQTRFQNQAHAYVQAKQRVNHVQKTFSPQPPALSVPRAEEVRLLPLAHSQQLKHSASHKQWRPSAPPAMASRQRSWITAAVAATAASLFLQFFHSGTKRRAEALKQQRAAIVIQKLFRLKLVPYYVRQLANAVVTLKPWMTSALLRWRRRRLNRSADILRHTLISSMQSNKIFLSIRAFRRKVVLLQRNIRSFLACTHARVVRLLKLLHIQVMLIVAFFTLRQSICKLILDCSVHWWPPSRAQGQRQSKTVSLSREGSPHRIQY
jgi:hypothetical protein